MSNEWDDLGRRLDDLSSDLGDVLLPGPHAARRRARQRTRRQVAGAGLGAAAAAAVGAIVLGGLGPLSAPPPDPVDTPTPAPTPPTPAPTPAPTGDAEVPDDEMTLTVESLEAASEVSEPVGWAPAEGPPGEPFLCAPSPGDAERMVERWFRPSDDGYLHQIIEIGTAGTAQARFDSVIDEVLSCVEQRNAENPDDNWLSNVWTVDGIGDGAWLGEYAVPPRGPNGELMIVQVSVVLAGDRVTIITQGGPGMHGHEAGPLPYDVAAAAADRLCSWAGRDCTGDPTPTRVYPPVRSDVEPGWLTIDDVVAAMPYFDTISAVTDVRDVDEYGHGCMEANPVAAGATAVPSRQYHDPSDDAVPPNVQLFEFVARFDTEGEALAHYEDLVDDMESCGEQSVTEHLEVDPTGQASADGYEGVTWHDGAESGGFHLGAAINGSSIAVIMVRELSPAEGELRSEDVPELLDRAAARLAELE
ncbi:MAG: hypothetical protein ACOC96_00935 [Actinomycetota bacterium]